MTQYPPCLNPNCKSYNKSHPHCRCYDQPIMMAHGGDVSLCQGMHEPGCEHYLDPEEAVAAVLVKLGALRLLTKTDSEKHSKHIKSGRARIEKAISSLFDDSPMPESSNTDKHNEKLSDYIRNGGIVQNIKAEMYQKPEDFAEGGEVEDETEYDMDHPISLDNDLSDVSPEQNVMLSTAKGTISNYLNSQRPLPYASKLAFDEEPDSTEHDKNYQKVLNLANDPISILGHIKNGEIDPVQIQHFSTLYPEVNQHLQKKLTERITEAQLSKEAPKYHIRQGLSMFLGVPLDGTLTSQAIQAAQATFQKQKGNAQQGADKPKAKNSKASLNKIGQAYETSEQSRDQRSQKN